MPRTVDLNVAIRSIVEAEINRASASYRHEINELHKRMDAVVSALSGALAGHRRPGRPPKALTAVRTPGRRPAAAKRNGKGDASRFHEGQKVMYRQGRGEFEAVVVKVDPETNVVTIERNKDGKKVDRPAAKIYEVA